MTDNLPDDYAATMERMWAVYESRVRDFLLRVKGAINDAGWWTGDIYDLSDDTYRLSFPCAPSGELLDDDHLVDVTCEIGEAIAYGDEAEYGVSFRLDVVEYNGRILIQWAPYNFTDQCWVDARSGISLFERWEFFSLVNVGDFVPFVTGETEGGAQPFVNFIPARRS